MCYHTARIYDAVFLTALTTKGNPGPQAGEWGERMARVPVTVSLPADLKARLDAAALEHGRSVSEVVTEALEAQLEPGRVVRLLLASLEQSDAKRRYLEDQIQVIADFIADHVGHETEEP